MSGKAELRTLEQSGTGDGPRRAPRVGRPTGGRSAGGFTLVEILAALAILAFGLAGIMSVIYLGVKQGGAAADRNAVALVVPQAVELIERQHLITTETMTAYDPGHPEEVGAYIETLNGADTGDGGPYAAVKVGKNGKTLGNGQLNAISPLSFLPTDPNEFFYVGDHVSFDAGAESYTHSSSYRVHYRLEKHPDWWPHNDNGTYAADDEYVDSPFVGVYVLTLTVYRASSSTLSNDRQVGNPVVIYLHDKKARD